MRSVTRIVLGWLMLTCCAAALADEGGGRWWPFRSADDAAQSSIAATAQAPGRMAAASTLKSPSANISQVMQRPAAQDIPTSLDDDAGWMSLPKPNWPAIHLPEVPVPNLSRPKFFSTVEEPEAPGNRWHQPRPEPPAPSAWDSVKGGARRMRQSTRSAWDKTVDVLTPGESDRNAPLARREPPKPPFWKRMLGVDDERDRGPQTVTEWMAQDRLNP